MLGRALAVVCLLAPLACGSGGGSGSGGAGGSSGEFHPTPNGKALIQDNACSALVGAIQSKFQALSCVGTTRQCPEFLTAQFGSCLEYDEGTIAGCASYYDQQTTCDDLERAITGCVIAPIAGSAGKGCP